MAKNTISVQISEETIRQLQLAIDVNKTIRAENERLTAALILLKQYAEPTPGGHVINNAPMSIIDNALEGDK